MKIDDKHILNVFVNKNNKVISSRINKKNILKYPDEIIYLKNRFPNDDFISYKYFIQKIKNDIVKIFIYSIKNFIIKYK